MPHCSKRRAASQPTHDSSDSRQRSWRPIHEDRRAVRKRGRFDWAHPHAAERHWHGIGNLRKRTGQGVQSAALIVQVQDAMMMVGIGRYDSARDVNVSVPGDGSTFEYVQRVVIHKRNDARDLGDYEERQGAATKAADRSSEPHVRLYRWGRRPTKHSLAGMQSR